MWSFVPMVCLLIGAIIGSCEIVDGLYVAQPGDENNDMSTDNRDGKTVMDLIEAWKEKEPLMIEEIYEKKIDPNIGATDGQRRNGYLDATDNAEYNRRINSLVNTKRREILESWYDPPRESEELQHPLPLSQKKKKKKKKTTTTTAVNPWIYRWGNRKRQNADGGSSSVRRPIRVPFNSWGGKRGEEYSRSAAIFFPVKRTRLTTYDRYDRDGAIDGYDVKREATDMDKVRWKTPFNSWGGKRAGKSTDRERYLRLLMERDFKTLKPHEMCKKAATWNPWGGKRSFETDPVSLSRDFALLAYSFRGNGTFLCCYPIVQPK